MKKNQIDKYGLRHGLWEFRDKQKNLLNIENYKHGILNGRQTIFHPSGIISLIFFKKSGLTKGKAIWYFENGEIMNLEYYI